MKKTIIPKETPTTVKRIDEEQALDRCFARIADGEFDAQLKGMDPAVVLRLLLKRADQRRVDRRIELVERSLKANEPVKETKRKLTPAQRQEKVKQILGIA